MALPRIDEWLAMSEMPIKVMQNISGTSGATYPSAGGRLVRVKG
jgi:hypothetical protein